MRNQFMSHRRGYTFLAAATVIVLAGVAGVIFNPFKAAAGQGPTLAASSFAALSSTTNLVAGVPAAVTKLGPEYTPAAGQVHALSGGAYAWRSGSQTCWATSHSSGCLDPLQQPIDWSVGDADVAGSGAPTQVYGLAVDGVSSVTATLADGSQITATPSSNFYTLSLPTQDGPWDVTSITAAFGAGGRYTTSVAIAKPGQG